jgi:hypothetical protein
MISVGRDAANFSFRCLRLINPGTGQSGAEQVEKIFDQERPHREGRWRMSGKRSAADRWHRGQRIY